MVISRTYHGGKKMANTTKLALEASLKKLLALKLKYMAALQKEYTAPNAEPLGKEITPAAILEAYRGLYNRVLTGQITEEQATREGAILSDILKVCEAQALQDKIDLLQRTLGGR